MKRVIDDKDIWKVSGKIRYSNSYIIPAILAVVVTILVLGIAIVLIIKFGGFS